MSDLYDFENDLKRLVESSIDGLPNQDQDDWVEMPVSPEEFIRGADFFGDKDLTEVWPCILEDMIEIFSGDATYAPRYHTVVDIEGIGSGKSTKIALFFSYIIHRLSCLRSPAKHFNLLDITGIALMNMAPSAKTAHQIIFDKVIKTIDRIPWFRNTENYPDPKIRSELIFPKSLRISPGNSSRNFPLGCDLYGGVIDEAQMFVTQQKDPVEDLYHDLHERRRSRFNNEGVVFLISSAALETCYMERLYLMAEEDPGILAIRRAQYDAKPHRLYDPPLCGKVFSYKTTREKVNGEIEELELKIPTEFEGECRSNPRRFLNNVCGIPSLSIEPYFEEFDRVLSAVNRDRRNICKDAGHRVPETPTEKYRMLPDSFRGEDGVEYVAHIDLATGGKEGLGCACGFAMGHRGPDKVIYEQSMATACIDLITRFKGAPGGEISFEEVRKFVWQLKQNRGFNITRVTFDGWNSIDSVQTLNSLGFLADISSADLKAYECMKTMVYEGRVDFYYEEVLIYELKRLEKKKNSVDHALLASKDEADCFARVCYMISEEVIEAFENDKKPKRARLGKTSQGIAGTNRTGGPFQNRGNNQFGSRFL